MHTCTPYMNIHVQHTRKQLEYESCSLNENRNEYNNFRDFITRVVFKMGTRKETDEEKDNDPHRSQVHQAHMWTIRGGGAHEGYNTEILQEARGAQRVWSMDDLQWSKALMQCCLPGML